MRAILPGFLPLLLAGCAGLAGHPSLGTYYVDEERIVVRGIDEGDTLATLSWGDSLEVIDAPLEVRTSEDLFVVRGTGGFGRAERDALMSDVLFRSKYGHGRPIGVRSDGRRFYLDEFGDTVYVRRRPNLVRKPADGEVDVVEEKELLKRKGRKRSRR